LIFFFSSRRRHTRCLSDWSSDVCSSDLVTHFVAGLGTSGTFIGAGRALRAFNPAIKLISFQPDSPFHGLEGLKHMASALVPKIRSEERRVGKECACLWWR